MNLWDALILFLVGLMLYFALRAVRSGRGGSCHSAGCSGNCSSCSQHCESCGGGTRKS